MESEVNWQFRSQSIHGIHVCFRGQVCITCCILVGLIGFTDWIGELLIVVLSDIAGLGGCLYLVLGHDLYLEMILTERTKNR